MQQQLPVALQVALYAASGAILVSAIVMIYAVFNFRKKLERLVDAVEEVKAEMMPLAREARVVVKRIGDLSDRAERQWPDVERVIVTARHWSERVDVLVDEIGSVVEPPIAALAYGARRLRSGLNTLVRVLLHRNQFQQTEARES